MRGIARSSGTQKCIFPFTPLSQHMPPLLFWWSLVYYGVLDDLLCIIPPRELWRCKDWLHVRSPQDLPLMVASCWLDIWRGRRERRQGIWQGGLVAGRGLVRVACSTDSHTHTHTHRPTSHQFWKEFLSGMLEGVEGTNYIVIQLGSLGVPVWFFCLCRLVGSPEGAEIPPSPLNQVYGSRSGAATPDTWLSVSHSLWSAPLFPVWWSR